VKASRLFWCLSRRLLRAHTQNNFTEMSLKVSLGLYDPIQDVSGFASEKFEGRAQEAKMT